MSRDCVVLADCFTRSGLAVARSLGRRGLKVVAVARSADTLVAKSRYVESLSVGPDPVEAPSDYAGYVAKVAGDHDARLVIPVTDAGLAALNEYRDSFAPDRPLALPAYDSVIRVLDKRRNIAMARDLGVPCPREFELQSRSQVGDMIEALGFPIVVKDATPNTKKLERPLPFRFVITQDESELNEVLDIVDTSDAEPLFQQCVSGAVVNVCSLALDGEILACHAYVSQRRSDHEGIAREVIDLDPRLAEYARLMSEELDWTGVLHMQFFVDSETGDCNYIETNGRFWASTQGTINAGWDIPWWFYQALTSGSRPDVPPIQPGSRTVYHKGDFEQLLKHLILGPAHASGYSGRLAAVGHTLREFAPGVKSDVWMWSDLKPALYDYWQLFSASNLRTLVRQRANR